MASGAQSRLGLQKIAKDPAKHAFTTPSKRINDGSDVSFFLSSKAYADIMTFLLDLNASMFPRRQAGSQTPVQVLFWNMNKPELLPYPAVNRLASMLARLTTYIDEAPPDTGPRRFGNVSFRKWFDLVEYRVGILLDEFLPALSAIDESEHSQACKEIQAYLLGSFGSAQRLDYGTGHELSFLAFLECIWKLGGFESEDQVEDGSKQRAIVLGAVQPYLDLIRRLIKTYTLEPAGSHGVWGLDDHSFLPYIFGSAQLAPAIDSVANIPAEGSRSDAPDPGDVMKTDVVERERKNNMYFAAIAFIYDVKKGPFWEHSPVLYDISGIRAGWAKINKGMIKMYNAEVLSKFPVVQHFPFGYLFPWEHDPTAAPIAPSPHLSSQPTTADGQRIANRPQNDAAAMPTTAAPWASAKSTSQNATGLPTGIPASQRVPDSSRTPGRK